MTPVLAELAYWQSSILKVVGVLLAVLLPAGAFDLIAHGCLEIVQRYDSIAAQVQLEPRLVRYGVDAGAAANAAHTERGARCGRQTQ